VLYYPEFFIQAFVFSYINISIRGQLNRLSMNITCGFVSKKIGKSPLSILIFTEKKIFFIIN